MANGFHISIHTGPVTSENSAHLVGCLQGAGAHNILVGTERIYFDVAGGIRQGYGNIEDRPIVDAIDANLAARNLLKKAFGAACGFVPVVGKALAQAEEFEEGCEEPPGCPTCGGEGALLGALGRVTHYRCRNCGIDYSND